MGKYIYFRIILLYLTININQISNFEIHQIPDSSQLLEIIQDTSKNIYYFTLTSIGKIFTDGTNTIISNTVNLKISSKVTFVNNEKTKFAISCTQNNAIEIYNSDGSLIDSVSYETLNLFETNYKCSIDYDYTNNKIYYGHSYYDSNTNEILYNVIVFILDSNSQIVSYKITDFRKEILISSEDELFGQCINCASLTQPMCFLRQDSNLCYASFDDDDTFLPLKLVRTRQDHIKMDFINYENYEMTIYEYENDQINVKNYFGPKNFNGSREINSYTDIDRDIFQGTQILENENSYSIFYAYKSGKYLVLDYSTYTNKIYKTLNNVFLVENKIGYSQVFVSSISSNIFFIITRGNETEPNTLEYFFFSFNELECNSYIAKAYSNQLIKIDISNIISSYDASNDICYIYPDTTDARINNNNEIELLSNSLDYGSFSFQIRIKTIQSDHFKFFISKECLVQIQVCNDRCSKCERNDFSLTGNPSNCSSKMCLDDYYYKLDDTTNCLDRTNTCYNLCNTCSEEGDENENKCESCKVNLILHKTNCIYCDTSKLYWYYDTTISKTECQYTNTNKCPENFNYLIVDTNECVNSCYGDYSYLYKDNCLNQCPENTAPDSNNECQCSYNYYKDLDNNNEIICLNSNACTNINYPYFINGISECYKECPSNYYKMSDNSDYLCYSQCPNNYYKMSDNSDYLCYSECPSNYDYKLNNTITYECYNTCPSNYFLVKNSKLCVKSCENSFTLNETSNLCECNEELTKVSDYELTCKILFNTNEYLQSIITNSSSPTELVNNVAENIEILKETQTVINTLNISIQVINSSTTDVDLNSNNNLSSIYLGECETILKDYYNLDKSLPLIILLVDSSSNSNSLINSLTYKVFDQDGNELNLDLCSDTTISIYYAITNEDGNVNIALVEYLSGEGIDFLNISSDFYHQRCFGFNYNGNDITTNDRQKDIYSSVSVCESECNYLSYDEQNKRVKCVCSVVNENYTENISTEKEEAKNFFDSLNDQIDYKLFVCYKVFKYFFWGFKKNFGFWFWFISFVFFIIEEILFWCTSIDKLYSKILKSFEKPIIKKHVRFIGPGLNPPKKNYEKQYINDLKKEYSNNNKFIDFLSKFNPFNDEKNIKTLKMKKTNNNMILTPKRKNTGIDYKHKDSITIYKKPTNISTHHRTATNSLLLNKKSDKNKIKVFDEKLPNSIYKSSLRKLAGDIDIINTDDILVKNINNDNIDITDDNYKKKHHELMIKKYGAYLSEKEENNYYEMAFHEALSYDHRAFLKMYLSFLFLKIELLSTIFFPEPFSVYTITLPFYVLMLLIDFTLNALVYTDDIVSQKYSNNGKLAFITSTLLGGICNIITYFIMKLLYKLINYSIAFETMQKEIKIDDVYFGFSKVILDIVRKRLIIYFVIEIIISLCCGYYLYIFCSVYEQSQMSLFINYLYGIGISLILSIGITLIVTIIRLISIKIKSRNLYYTSRYLSNLI